MFVQDLQSNSEYRMSDYAEEATRRQALSVARPRREHRMVQPWTVRWMFARVVHFRAEHISPRHVRRTGFRGMYPGSFGSSNR